MFAYIKYRKRIKQAEKHLQSLKSEYNEVDKRLANRIQDDGMEMNDIAGQIDETENWISLIQTEYLQKECRKLVIPTPKYEEEGYYSVYNFDDLKGDRFIFSTEGFHKVRGTIRQEKKEKREAFGFWFAIVTGLIGATIGLISVSKIGF